MTGDLEARSADDLEKLDVPEAPIGSLTTPWYRRPWISGVLVVTAGVLAGIATLLGGCGSSAADPQPGAYRGGDGGFLVSFTVNETGAGVTEVFAQVTCGSIGRSETISFTPPLPIENGRFELEPPPSGGFGMTGRFIDDGTRSRGDWSTGSCSGDWTADHEPGTQPPGDSDVDSDVDADTESPQPETAPDDDVESPQPETAPDDDGDEATAETPAIEEPDVFVDEFDGVLDGGWLWRNEDPRGEA